MAEDVRIVVDDYGTLHAILPDGSFRDILVDVIDFGHYGALRMGSLPHEMSYPEKGRNMIPLKEGEKSHCGICKYCRVLFKSLKVPCPANYLPERTLCCDWDKEIWEVNENNFCDYFERQPYEED